MIGMGGCWDTSRFQGWDFLGSRQRRRKLGYSAFIDELGHGQEGWMFIDDCYENISQKNHSFACKSAFWQRRIGRGICRAVIRRQSYQSHPCNGREGLEEMDGSNTPAESWQRKNWNAKLMLGVGGPGNVWQQSIGVEDSKDRDFNLLRHVGIIVQTGYLKC